MVCGKAFCVTSSLLHQLIYVLWFTLTHCIHSTGSVQLDCLNMWNREC